MEQRLYLNKDAALIAGITQRQVQAWTDKGLIIPAKEASGGGSKRGYDYVNLLELGLCKELFSSGQGIQSVKIILGMTREKNIIKMWADNHLSYFNSIWKDGGPFAVGSLLIDNPLGIKIRELNRSIQRFLTMLQVKEKTTGILIYFFKGVFNSQPIILPSISPFLEEREDIFSGIYFIYSVLTQQEGVLLVNIGWIKTSIDEVLRQA